MVSFGVPFLSRFLDPLLQEVAWRIPPSGAPASSPPIREKRDITEALLTVSEALGEVGDSLTIFFELGLPIWAGSAEGVEDIED